MSASSPGQVALISQPEHPATRDPLAHGFARCHSSADLERVARRAPVAGVLYVAGSLAGLSPGDVGDLFLTYAAGALIMVRASLNPAALAELIEIGKRQGIEMRVSIDRFDSLQRALHTVASAVRGRQGPVAEDATDAIVAALVADLPDCSGEAFGALLAGIACAARSRHVADWARTLGLDPDDLADYLTRLGIAWRGRSPGKQHVDMPQELYDLFWAAHLVWRRLARGMTDQEALRASGAEGRSIDQQVRRSTGLSLSAMQAAGAGAPFLLPRALPSMTRGQAPDWWQSLAKTPAAGRGNQRRGATARPPVAAASDTGPRPPVPGDHGEWERFRAGDGSALTDLMRLYEPLLDNALKGREEDGQTRRAAINEAFARLSVRGSNLPAVSNVQSYLIRSVSNIIEDYRRHEAQERRHLAAAADRGMARPSSCGRPDTDFDAQEIQDTIDLALSKMTELQRYVYVEVRVKRRSHAAVAAERRISLKSVEKKVNKALTLIRTRLKPFVIDGAGDPPGVGGGGGKLAEERLHCMRCQDVDSGMPRPASQHPPRRTQWVEIQFGRLRSESFSRGHSW